MLRFALPLLIFLPVTAHSAPLDRFEGRYRGCAVSGGEWVPIETTLSVSGETLSGTYLFIESNGRRVSGSIALLDHDGGDRIGLVWRDLYGEGPATFEFDGDATRFDGHWTTGEAERRFDWNGVRLGAGRAIPDCRAPVS